MLPLFWLFCFATNALILAGSVLPTLAKWFVEGEPPPRSKEDMENQITSRQLLSRLLFANFVALIPIWFALIWIFVIR